MTVVVVGLNYRTAPEHVLARASLPDEATEALLDRVMGSDVIYEAVVLATCNRTEIYVHTARFHDGFRDVRDALAHQSGLDPQEFNPCLYVKYDDQAVEHLFTVASGLDSAVVGEHEILGQVSRAWKRAQAAGSTGPTLNILFQRTMVCGKRVRTETDIGRATTSLSQAAISTAIESGGPLDGKRVLLVGTGELGQEVAQNLSRQHRVSLTVTNRTEATATKVAAELGADVVPFGQMAAEVGRSDLVVLATGAPGAILNADAIAQVKVADHHLTLVDLAQPSDVTPDVNDLDGVTLITLIQVQANANKGLESRQLHVAAAQAMVADELAKFHEAGSERQVAPLVADLHGWAESIRGAELERYAAKLSRMGEADRATVEALSKSIVAKILHTPTVNLKSAAGSTDGERLADATRELFDRR